MKHQITLKNLDHTPQMDKLLNRLLVKLDKQLVRFGDDVVYLHGTLEKHPTRARYRISLVLHLPGRTLATQEEQPDPESTLREAFLELERQLKKHKAFLRNDHLWKRPARREEIRRQEKIEPIPAEDRQKELFFDLIQPHLKKLQNFVRHEIDYFEATGDLTSGELNPQAVVDAVILRASNEFNERSTHVEIDGWLVKLARDYLRAEVRRRRKERELTVHLEEDVPETPPEEQVVTLGDEILDFYQPDEDLRLEDVVPDSNAPQPDEELRKRDFQRYISQALAQLPRTWRDAFVLHHVHEFSLKDIAEITGQSEVDVKRQLEKAREFLRQKLQESGLARPA
jgi:RNA polymerase sigma factor (sigma-70 family)